MSIRRHSKLFLLFGLTALLLSTPLLASCGSSSIVMSKDQINVVTSFYPLYDFASEIGGAHVHVVNVVPTGVEPHDWAPKSRDISEMSKADLFIYQGAGLEGWADDFIHSLPAHSSLQIVKGSEGLNLISEEQSGSSEESSGGHSGEEHGGVDPHTWLSPANAKKMAAHIRDGLVKVDPAHRSEYEANYERLNNRLDELDRHYREQLSRTSRKDVVVTHRAFAYLCRDYGLEQMAIMGLSPDSEPTPQDMMHTLHFIRDHQVKVIFFEELVSNRLAKILAEDTKVKVEVLNPLEGLTDAELKAGDDYVSVMERNLQNLVQALQ